MPRIQLPENMNAVAVEGYQFNADSSGCIETGDAPDEIVAVVLNITRGKVVEQKPETIVEEARLTTERSDLIAKLVAAGAKFDKRWSIDTLRAAVAKAIEDQRT